MCIFYVVLTTHPWIILGVGKVFDGNLISFHETVTKTDKITCYIYTFSSSCNVTLCIYIHPSTQM